MKIREDFKSLIPPLSPDEFQQLEQNCIRDGIRDPLDTWNGVLMSLSSYRRLLIVVKSASRIWKQ